MLKNPVIRVLLLISIFNFAVILIKFTVGYMTNSQAIIADGVHSISDLTVNFIGIFAITLSSKPADKNHSYGHEKIETLASVAVSIFLFVISLKIFSEGVMKLINPTEITFTKLSLILMLATLAINIIVVSYEGYMGKKLKSSFLITDSKHTLSDVYITIGVIVSMIAIKLGAPNRIDAVISILVSFYIIKTALGIFRQSSMVLIDTNVIDKSELVEIIYSFKEVREIHHLRNRGNEVNVYVEFHVLFDGNMTVYDAHKIVDLIEEKIEERFSEYNFNFTVHIEPDTEQFRLNEVLND